MLTTTQPLADVAVKFTAADYAALMAIAFVTVATLLDGIDVVALFAIGEVFQHALEGGSVSRLFSTTLSIVLWALALLALVVPLIMAARRRSSVAAQV